MRGVGFGSLLSVSLSVVNLFKCAIFYFGHLFISCPLLTQPKFIRNVKSGGERRKMEREGQKEAVTNGKIKDEN